MNSLSMRRDPTWLLVPILALPLLLFNLTFINPFVSLPACIVLLAGLALGLRQFAEIGSANISLKILSICFGVALVGCLLGGQGRLFYATDDWMVRNAVLSDMVSAAWPPAYDWNGEPAILRAPLGIYLVPAFIGKAFGIGVAHFAFLIQNTIVFALILFGLTKAPLRGNGRVGIVAFFLLFSGLDVVPSVRSLLANAHTLQPSMFHLDSWAGRIQYSSHVTQLFWVPHHAFAGWVFVVFYLRWRKDLLGAPALAMVFGLCLLWSPLATIGALPFLLFATVVDLLRSRIRVTSLLAPGCIAAATVPVFLFLIMDSGAVEKGTFFFESNFWPVYGIFLAVEIGPFYLILRESPLDRTLTERAELVLVFGLLVLLPLFYVGFSNDLTMRASNPALALLALLVFEEIQLAFAEKRRARIWMTAVVIIGAATPAFEIARSFVLPSERFSTCNLLQAWRHSAWTKISMTPYLAREGGVGNWLLKRSEQSPLRDVASNCGEAYTAPLTWPKAAFSPHS
jgi:hypothetical protein